MGQFFSARGFFRWFCLVGIGMLAVSCASPAPLPMVGETLAPLMADTEVVQPSRTPLIRQLAVYPDQTLQTVREVGGGNFIHMFGGVTEATDPISDVNLKTLNPGAVRVSINLELWEPENDDADPSSMQEDRFRDVEGTFVRGTFEFMRKMSENGAIIAASVWRVPGWLVENPEDDSQQVIPAALYPEAVESLAAWLVRARDVYGVEVAYVSFNEANLGINVLLEPQNYIDLIRLAGPRFEELGLKTRWLLADSSNMGGTLSYAEAIWAAEDIRPYLGVLAYHSWDASAGDSTLEGIAEFAQRNGLEVWCAEGGWDPSMWQRPKEFPTWRHALNMAAVYTRALKMTRATTLLYWQMMGTDYTLNDGSQSYPALDVLRAMQMYFPSGGQIVKTSADKSMIKFTAQKSDDGFSVVVVNEDAFPEQVRITGLPDGTYRWLRYSTEEDGEMVAEVTVRDGVFNFELVKSSVNFFTTLQP